MGKHRIAYRVTVSSDAVRVEMRLAAKHINRGDGSTLFVTHIPLMQKDLFVYAVLHGRKCRVMLSPFLYRRLFALCLRT